MFMLKLMARKGIQMSKIFNDKEYSYDEKNKIKLQIKSVRIYHLPVNQNDGGWHKMNYCED